MDYEPELGQAVFSNSPWGEFTTPGYITRGIDVLADHISEGDFYRNPARNVGPEANFANDTFSMTAYCWCDGAPGHENGCPPNFKCGDFEARWYKHSHRGASQNQELTLEEWGKIFLRCLESIGG